MNHLLREDILRELDNMVCTKHPPDYDIECIADNIMLIFYRFHTE